MAVGIDQIAAGILDIATGKRDPSVFPCGGYSAAATLGFGDGTPAVIRHRTPLATSLLAATGATFSHP